MDIGNIGNSILSFVQEKASFLVTFLPRSPFRTIIDHIGQIPYIEYINWFLPIEECVLLLLYWGTAIGLYYAYSIILRWIKAID